MLVRILFGIVVFQYVPMLQLDAEWEVYNSKCGKEGIEASLSIPGRAIWSKRTEQIRIHNEVAARGRHPYHVDINQFGDRIIRPFDLTIKSTKCLTFRQTEKEIKSSEVWTIPLSRKMPQGKSGRFFTSTKIAEDLPAELDWRKKGIVTQVYNQGAGQNLVDCSKKQGNVGCHGGTSANCFQYISQNNGIDSRTAYPYQAIEGPCRFNRSSVAAIDSGPADIPTGNEFALQLAVAEIGPIAIAIDASLNSFREYNSGVYDDPKCNSTVLDHGMLVVGYGHDTSSGKDYCILKNTYGVAWGMKGYIYMARNRGNRCGVATMTSYPLI